MLRDRYGAARPHLAANERDEMLEAIRRDRELETVPEIVPTGSEVQEDIVNSYERCVNA